MINKYKRFTTDRILHFIYKRSKGTQETVSLTPLFVRYFGKGNQRQLLDCKYQCYGNCQKKRNISIVVNLTMSQVQHVGRD